MQFEFDIVHTEDGLRAVYREWWRARYGVAYWTAFGFAVFFFTAMFLLRSAHWPLVTGVAVSAAYAAFLQLLREQTIALVLKHAAILGLRFRYQADADSLRETSNVTTSEFRWSVLAKIVRQKDHLLLVRKPEEAQMFIALPLSQIPEGFETFVRERLVTR
jgi:hypothetical protein